MQVDCVGQGRRAARVDTKGRVSATTSQRGGNAGKKQAQDAKEARPSRGRQITVLHHTTVAEERSRSDGFCPGRIVQTGRTAVRWQSLVLVLACSGAASLICTLQMPFPAGRGKASHRGAWGADGVTSSFLRHPVLTKDAAPGTQAPKPGTPSHHSAIAPLYRTTATTVMAFLTNSHGPNTAAPHLPSFSSYPLIHTCFYPASPRGTCSLLRP